MAAENSKDMNIFISYYERSNNKKMTYNIVQHIRYEFGDSPERSVLIVPVVNNIPDMKHSLCLRKVSLEIWELLVSGTSDEKIQDILTQKYKIGSEEFNKDFLEFVISLKEHGYIREVNNDI